MTNDNYKVKTMQEVAEQILREKGRPMTSTDLAQEALNRRLIESNAFKPIPSLSATLDKNIRTDTYNKPELKHINTLEGIRYIGLPEHDESDIRPETNTEIISVYLPAELNKRVKILIEARLKPSHDETIAWLIENGINHLNEEIKEHINKLF